MPHHMLYLVRHAKAGDRAGWAGDDAERPLTKPGRRQADQLADAFAPLQPARLLSSPYVRCVQTLEPTAARTGTPVEMVEALSEGNSFEGVLALLAELPTPSVLCSHGDVIPAVLAALERRGTRIATAPDWRKAATWVLERDADGTIVSAAAWPPPS